MRSPVQRRANLSRRGLGLLGLPLLLLGCATAGSSRRADAPPPTAAGAYYPLVKGWKWAYEITRQGAANAGGTMLATYEVVEGTPGGAVVRAGDERLTYELRADGIARPAVLSGGDYLLKSPVAAGSTWALADGVAKVEAVGRTVEVPAGTFRNCAVVRESRHDPERVVTTTFAPEVGPVVIDLQTAAAESGGFEDVHAVLRGFTRPGQDPLSFATDHDLTGVAEAPVR